MLLPFQIETPSDVLIVEGCYTIAVVDRHIFLYLGAVIQLNHLMLSTFALGRTASNIPLLVRRRLIDSKII